MLKTTSEYLFGTLALNNTDPIPITKTLLLLPIVTYILVTFLYEINYTQLVNIYDVVSQFKRMLAVSISPITAIIIFSTSQLLIKFRESTARFADLLEIFLSFDVFRQLLL